METRGRFFLFTEIQCESAQTTFLIQTLGSCFASAKFRLQPLKANE